jgi:hypothetical protein
MKEEDIQTTTDTMDYESRFLNNLDAMPVVTYLKDAITGSEEVNNRNSSR